MSLSLRQPLRDFAAAYPPFNDFSVVTLHCFDDGQPKLSQLNGNLVLRLVDPATDRPYLTLLGKNRIAESIEALEKLTSEAISGNQLTVSAVPEVVISSLPTDGWIEQDEFAEYLFSIQHWQDCPTSSLRAKRRRADRFKERYPHVRIMRLDLDDSAICHRIDAFATVCWLRKGPLTCGPLAEIRGLLRCLASARELGCIGYGMEIAGSLTGFTILEPVHGGCVHSHLGSTAHGWDGLTEHFLFGLARELAKLGLAHINDHEDLGLNGLRQFKRAWEPLRLLKKYHCITEKPSLPES